MDLDANLIHFSINEYPIDDLNFVANIKDGEGNLKSIYKDKNLDLELDSYVEFDSISPKANIHLNLIGANLNNLGLSDRKSTRLNSSHVAISYAVFCLKKK